MTVAPFSLAQLPRVTSRAAAASRAIARRVAAAPRRIDLELRGLGRVVVRVRGPEAATEAYAPGDEIAFALVDGGAQAQLRLDVWTALRLCAAALGGPPPRMVRGLGAAERGVVAALVAGALAAAGSGARLRLAEPGPPGDDFVSVLLDVDAAGASAIVRLCVPSSWPDAAPSPSPVLPALPVEVAAEIATTKVEARVLAAAAPGDALVFDGVAPPRDGVPTSSVVIGRFRARARVRDDGALELSTAFAESAPMPASSDSPPSGTVSLTQVLHAAPVEVVAELGRVTLRGADVLALAPGAVLTLPPGRTKSVELRVSGAPWARGELVDVDGELGVRITELLARP